ncbi:MAG: phenylalanine--tRNA ligase subunit alpha [Pirellulaceae bacterium]
MSSGNLLSIDEFLGELNRLLNNAEKSFAAAGSLDTLEEARVEFLGAKSGQLKVVQKQLGQIAAQEKPVAGQNLNRVKDAIQAAFDAAKERMSVSSIRGEVDPAFDRTEPGNPLRIGRMHPITQTIKELTDIMGRLGFTPARGPEVEDERHNFEALNIPADHPARDPLENFYLSLVAKREGHSALLRSQTSTVQIRIMETTQPPIRVISLGRVYRPDTADPTHYPMFHQMEGLMVDRNVNLATLKTVLQLFATNYLGKSVPVRIRPSFFPFTEPSVEADYFWNGRWTEFGGAGIVDPNVFRAVGYDPEVYTGFAFGLGVERLCMIRHGITDIRDMYTNDVRFLRQF